MRKAKKILKREKIRVKPIRMNLEKKY